MTRSFQKTVLATSLAMVMGSASATAIKPNAELQPSKVVNTQKGSTPRDISDLYFIHFEQAPLASYQSQLEASAQAKHLNKHRKLNVHSSASQTYVKQLQQQRASVLSQVQGVLKRSLVIENEYNYVANAITARLSEEEVALLQGQAGIRFVDKVQLKALHTDTGPAFIKAPAAWHGTAGTLMGSMGEGMIVGVLDTGINPHSPSFADIGADGYDHTNPLGEGNYLADCIEYAQYCNDKLIGIWSHEVITSKDTPEGEAPIGLDYHSHGSHTASTAAGNFVRNVPINVMVDGDGNGSVDIDYQSDYQFEQISGVAPHANIVSYQVCDNGEMGCWTDLTVLAVEHAVANGVDVLNYSVGGGASDAWYDSDALAFLNARKAGIHVATSAGNSGPDPQTIGSPGNAPWLTTVAAYTHDRDFSDKTLGGFSGGTTSLTELSGKGVTGALTAPIVLAENYGDADCLTPFAEGTFNGQIVVCNRGQIARVEKGINVAAGGAAGLVLVNTSSEEDVVNDYHFVPAVHLDSAQGDELVSWLKSGEDHVASIGDSALISNPDSADKAAWFTSRGPEPIFDQYLAPHIAAPGVDIYAASAQYDKAYSAGAGERAAYMFMSGTSMSSPHVAGALTLMAALKPHWSPAEIQSAMMLTAHFDTEDHTGVASNFYDGGAGSLRIDKALKSGLLMDISYQEYLDASPSDGGDASTLNMPAMLDSGCFMSCTWARTFKATAEGTWTVSDAPISAGISVTAEPSKFTLSAGEEITLEITASATAGLSEETVFSHLVLTSNNEDVSEAKLPVIASFIAGSAPQQVSVEKAKDSGEVEIENVTTVGTDALNVTTYPLSKVHTETVELPRDDNDTATWPTSVYNNSKYNWSTPVSVNDKAKALVVKISNTTSPDLDLYVGRDGNWNGKLDGALEFDNLTCMSATETAYESCYIVNPPKGNYAIEIHNFGDPDTATGEFDSVSVEWVVISSESEHQLEAEYISQLAAQQDAQLKVSWNSTLTELTQYMGAVEIGTSESTPDNIGFTYVEVLRAEDKLAVSTDNSEIVAGDLLTYTLAIKPNREQAQTLTQVSTQLPEQLSVQSSSDEFTQDGNQLTWQITQTAEQVHTLTVTLDTSKVTKHQLAELVFTAVTDSENEQIDAEGVYITGLPHAEINQAEQSADEGESVTFSAAQSTAPGSDETLSYRWVQLSGPEVTLTDAESAELVLTAPQVDEQSSVLFEVTVSNGRHQATAQASLQVNDVPAAPEVPVTPEPSEPPVVEQPKQSSGSFSWLVGLLLATRLVRRR